MGNENSVLNPENRNYFNGAFDRFQRYLVDKIGYLEESADLETDEKEVIDETAIPNARKLIKNLQDAWDESQKTMCTGGEKFSYRSTVQQNSEMLLIDIVDCLNDMLENSQSDHNQRLQALIERIPEQRSRVWDKILVMLTTTLLLGVGLVGVIAMGFAFPPSVGIFIVGLCCGLSAFSLITGASVVMAQISARADLATRQEQVLKPLKDNLAIWPQSHNHSSEIKQPLQDHYKTKENHKKQPTPRKVASGIQPQVNFFEEWFSKRQQSSGSYQPGM